MSPSPEQPLWSERRGGTLTLTSEGFATLLVDAFEDLFRQGLFHEVLGLDPERYFTSSDTARAFFSMKLGDPWAGHCDSQQDPHPGSR